MGSLHGSEGSRMNSKKSNREGDGEKRTGQERAVLQSKALSSVVLRALGFDLCPDQVNQNTPQERDTTQWRIYGGRRYPLDLQSWDNDSSPSEAADGYSGKEKKIGYPNWERRRIFRHGRTSQARV